LRYAVNLVNVLTNQHIAKLIDETADLMEIADMDAFRVRSYRNASVIIQNYLEPVAEIAADPEREVTEIQGIGKGIKEVLDQILDHGSFDRRDELLKRYPQELHRLGELQEGQGSVRFS